MATPVARSRFEPVSRQHVELLPDCYYRLRHPGVDLLQLTPIVELTFLNMFKVPWYTDGQPLPDLNKLG